MNISTLLTSIGGMAVLIGLGILISRFVTFTPDMKRLLIFLIVNVGLPSLIFHSIIQLDIDGAVMLQVAIVLGFTLFLHIALLFLMKLLASSMGRWVSKPNETAILSTLGNTGIIGIPLCATLFGPKGALFAAVFDAGMAITLWSISVLLLQKNMKFNPKSLKTLLNMPFVAVVSGLTVAFSGIMVPSFAKEIVGTVAHMTTALAMIYLGLLISSSLKNTGPLLSWRVVPPVVGKLIVFPILAALLILVFRIPLEIAQVIFLLSTMPMAATIPILFAKYGADENYGLVSSIVATIVSIITIPVLLYAGGTWVFAHLS